MANLKPYGRISDMENRCYQTSFLILLAITIVGCQSTHQNVVRDPYPYHPEKKLAISTSEPLVAEAAAEIFQQGGNIADAAVAASFAISVVRPQSTGLGGGGFLVSYFKGQSQAWDFRETAPYLSRRDMFLKKDPKTKKLEVIPDLSSVGPKAAATPGLVAGLYEFHQKHGHLKWVQVLQPAIRLAGTPISVSAHMARALRDMSEDILKDPEMTKVFTQAGEVLEEGDTFVQPDLKSTLEGIASGGKKYFYRGEFASKLGAWSAANKAVLNAGDLKMYQVKIRKPLQVTWRNYQVLSMPPPSSGGLHLLQILKMVDAVRVKSGAYGAGSTPPSLQVPYVAEIEAMKRAFADRAVWLGDPDYVKVPVEELLSDSYIQKRADEIGEAKILPAKEVLPWSKEKTNHETTHISLMDSDGNAISTTQTVNGYFGAAVMVPGTGVILNNEMDDFSVKPGVANIFGLVGGKFNEIAPGKRPLSSMTPTIVVNDKKEAVLAIGAPGGSRIITGTYYVLSRILREGQSVGEALGGCRFHHQWSPDKVTMEPACFAEAGEALKKFYPVVEEAKPFFFGEVQVVQRSGVDKDADEAAVSEGYTGDVLTSGVDPRGHGVPMVVGR